MLGVVSGQMSEKLQVLILVDVFRLQRPQRLKTKQNYSQKQKMRREESTVLEAVRHKK